MPEALGERAPRGGGVWYGGGALSHWKLDSITDFNHSLARRVAKQLGFGLRDRARLLRVDQLAKDW